MGIFEDLLSFTEAAKEWGLHPATLRRAIEYGRLKPDIDCRLFGHQWIVTKTAMRNVFGERPEAVEGLKRKIPISELPCETSNIPAKKLKSLQGKKEIYERSGINNE